MREVVSGIEIDATPARVWNVLADFSRYPEWNPFIRFVQGELAVGEELAVHMRLPSGREISFHPVIEEAEPELGIRWLGKLWIPKLFDGEHEFEIHALESNRTLFIQRERFSGLLVPLLWKRLEPDILSAFERMNIALKMMSEYLEHRADQHRA